MDLTLLAPDMKVAILELPQTLDARDPVRERHVRLITAEAGWRRQHRMWRGTTSDAVL